MNLPLLTLSEVVKLIMGVSAIQKYLKTNYAVKKSLMITCQVVAPSTRRRACRLSVVEQPTIPKPPKTCSLDQITAAHGLLYNYEDNSWVRLQSGQPCARKWGFVQFARRARTVISGPGTTWHVIVKLFLTALFVFRYFLDGWNPHNKLDNLHLNYKGVTPLFSCENERFVSLALLAGSRKIVGTNGKSRGHDLYCLSGRGSGAIFA